MRWRWLAPGMGLVGLGLFGYSATLDVGSENVLVGMMGLIAFAAPTLAGAYLAWRLPGNPIGWILTIFGLTFTVGAIGETVALTDSPLAPWGGWLGTWQWVVSMTLILVQLPLRYPDGRLPSPRYGWVTPISALGVALVFLGNAFRSSVAYATPGGEVVVDLPFPVGLPADVFDVASMLGMSLLLACVAGALVAAVGRFRRSVGVERQQMKVFASALAFSISGMAANLVLYETGNVAAGNVVFALLVVILVSSIALAVLRYRLYEFDRLVSRTLSYAVIVLILGSIYVVGAVWLPARLASGESPLFVAGSTLAAAALFSPLRRRVMRWVERRFNRSRYDPERIADQMANRLKDQVDAEHVAEDWAQIVTGTLQPSSVGVWIRE